MSYSTSHGQRWNVSRGPLVPAGLLQDAPPPRSLVEVLAPITPWGNAFRIALDHEIEVAALEREADRNAWSHPCLAL
jgi:hypothetical protein